MQQAQADALPRPRLQARSVGQTVRDIAETIVLVAVIYTLVNLASARFVVDGASMRPNFETGEFLIVSRVNYLLSEPQRGDVVVFHFPGNLQEDYIKRVIGVPGDQIEIRDTQVYVNGDLLNEPYINEPCDPSHCPDESWTLGADEFLVMGDNRNHSSDSRGFGPIPRRVIVGEALLRYWPPQDWGIVRAYND